MKLYLYSDFCGAMGWFPTAAKFRAAHPGAHLAIRCAHEDIQPPAGYHKPHGHLAFNAAEPIRNSR